MTRPRLQLWRNASSIYVNLCLLIISYGWLSQKHANHTGFHLLSLKLAAESTFKYFTWINPFADKTEKHLLVCSCVFWDFVSLYQVTRTSNENALFRDALANLHLLYSHPSAVVL